MKEIRFGIVGTGPRSSSYFSQIARVPRARLTAACDKVSRSS